MTEDFLHYVWKYRLFSCPELITATGERVAVLHPGRHNHHAGPDFSDARIRIGDTLWAGPVEIHLKSSDWHRHQHEGDPRYGNVILHVVYDNDVPVFLRAPGDLPVLSLKPYIDERQWQRYQSWLTSGNEIPCFRSVSAVDELIWTNWKDRLLIERLEEKSAVFLEDMERLNGDREEAFYRFIARSMGFRVNADPFFRLAQALPLSVLKHHRWQPFQIEALLFGVSGLLPMAPEDDYPCNLLREFSFLQKKYGLITLEPGVWNTGRVRPNNHPCLRIAQFAGIVGQDYGLFTWLTESLPPEKWMESLRAPVAEYWWDRYFFDDPNGSREIRRFGEGRMGKSSLENLLINGVAVALSAYGQMVKDEKILDSSLKMLEFCEAEKNGLLTRWKGYGVAANHAADSQALIQLTNRYCLRKGCLQCMIGLQLIRGTHAESDT